LTNGKGEKNAEIKCDAPTKTLTLQVQCNVNETYYIWLRTSLKTQQDETSVNLVILFGTIISECTGITWAGAIGVTVGETGVW